MTEPVNIFGPRIDPEGVLDAMRNAAPHTLELERDADGRDWTRATVTLSDGRPFTVIHDRGYYAGPNWKLQMLGMGAYFEQEFPDSPGKARVIELFGTFRFALAFGSLRLDMDQSVDPAVKLVLDIADAVDGYVFTPSSLRDANGQALIRRDDNAADEARIHYGDDDEPLPPEVERVMARAQVLAAVGARGLIENDDTADESDRVMVRGWLGSLGIDGELEPAERRMLDQPVGSLTRQETIDATWRLEGLAVLAWALGVYELPPDDEMVNPGELFDAVGAFDPDDGPPLRERAAPRSNDERDAMRARHLMLNWRLRQFTLRPEAMDFVAFSKDCWWASFDASTFRLVGNDLAIGDVALADASPEAVSLAHSISRERHIASNWLCGYHRIYSAVTDDT